MKRASTIILSSFLLVGCAIIDPGERGIKVELGVVKKDILAPGLVSLNPLTETIRSYSIQQSTVSGKAEPLTADQQPISVEYKVLYKIPEGPISPFRMITLVQNQRYILSKKTQMIRIFFGTQTNVDVVLNAPHQR